MAQKKGQTGNPNGRPKGAKNKVTSDLREWVQKLVDDNRSMIEKDLQNITEPAQRLAIMEKFLQYSLPKLASVDINAQIEAQLKLEYAELEKLLHNAPDEALRKISDKVMELSKHNKQRE